MNASPRTAIAAATGLALAVLLAGCGRKEEPKAAAAAQAQKAPGAGAAKGSGGPGAGKGGPPELPPIPVAVEPATRGPIASYYATTASLEANKNADILARVSGVVTAIPAEEGDRVTSGAALLSVEDREYSLRLAQAEAEAEKQETRFARLEKMFSGSLVSAEEFEAAKNDRSGAEAARDLAKLELSYTRVTAPFSGRVVHRHVDVGQNVNPGTALFTLADLDPLLARVHVPAKEFRSIRRDQPVELTLDSNGERLQGHITLVSPVVDPTSGTIKVTVEIRDYPAEARPGDFAQVRIVTERRDHTLLVPKGAVIADKGEQVVYVAAADSTAERRVVDVGFQDDEHAEIVKGLSDGERVVIQGQRSLKHGSRLKLMEKMRFESAAPADTAGKRAS